jgi:hypothetical protein
VPDDADVRARRHGGIAFDHYRQVPAVPRVAQHGGECAALPLRDFEDTRELRLDHEQALVGNTGICFLGLSVGAALAPFVRRGRRPRIAHEVNQSLTGREAAHLTLLRPLWIERANDESILAPGCALAAFRRSPNQEGKQVGMVLGACHREKWPTTDCVAETQQELDEMSRDIRFAVRLNDAAPFPCQTIDGIQLERLRPGCDVESSDGHFARGRPPLPRLVIRFDMTSQRLPVLLLATCV